MRIVVKAAALGMAAAACLGMGNHAQVVAVYPSGARVPANLLRVSIAFDRPPHAPVLPRLALEGAQLEPGQAPFLDQALWTPDGRILTVLFDPGRLKTGVGANERLGRVLREGEAVTLELDGRALKRWEVAAADTVGPHPERWTVQPPETGSLAPVVVVLDAPIDMLDQDLVAVVSPGGQPLDGRIELAQGEQRWSFAPKIAWQPGRYRILVSPELEDAAGNAVARPFEVKGPVTPARRLEPVTLDFVVSAGIPRSRVAGRNGDD